MAEKVLQNVWEDVLRKYPNTSLAAKGVLANRLQRRNAAPPHRLPNPKLPPGGPKMADGVWKGVYP